MCKFWYVTTAELSLFEQGYSTNEIEFISDYEQEEEV